jgi:hypothetical protein
MRLDGLHVIDYSDEIAALPKHRGYSVLPPRVGEDWVTFHYSAVDYADRSEAVELRRILSEASYQLHHNYGKWYAPAYPDGMLYDVVVLSSGQIVKTRGKHQQLWHVGNSIGNAKSYAVHVMLGGNQNVTPAQRQGVFNVFDALRRESGIPRQNVIAHCEWPRSVGLPIRASSYRLLPGQSACPGAVLFKSVVLAYRNMPDVITPPQPPIPQPVTQYRVKLGGGTLRTAPMRSISNVVRNIAAGTPLNIAGTVTGENVLGSAVWMAVKGTPVMYIHSSAVERM